MSVVLRAPLYRLRKCVARGPGVIAVGCCGGGLGDAASWIGPRAEAWAGVDAEGIVVVEVMTQVMYSVEWD